MRVSVPANRARIVEAVWKSVFAKLPQCAGTLAGVNLDTLRVKLFLAIAGGTAALALGAYLVFSWSFDRGFVNYVNEAEEARLEPLVPALADKYRREGGWDWVARDRRAWYELVRETVGLPPVTIDPRLMLFDAGKTQLFGRPENAPQAVLKEIEVDAKTVGYLGYVRRPEALASIDRLYLRRQHLAFGAIAVGMLAAALLLGAGLSQWLSRRIRDVAAATASLTQGNYDVRLKPEGRDELARLAADFNALAEALSAARASRQQWIADIAHELRTPLSILRGEIEALQDGVRPLDRNAVNSLANEAARLARLVEDLHTLSLSDLGALSYHKEPVDLAEVVEEVVDAQRGLLRDQGLQIELRTEPATLLGDAGRLAQVFANLLQNSTRYTHAPGRISVSLKRQNGNIDVLWDDTSPGVPDAELARLTERLYRVDGSRSRDNGGSGLGLAIAHAIVAAHGGSLAAAASPLGGLRIKLVFPAILR
jgi:two-component system sensor histidine kinase BaeS